MSTRAKFTVESKTEVKDGYRVRLTAVIGSSAENATFFKYTPSGVLEMGLVQESTADQFVVGKSYYIDFTEVA